MAKITIEELSESLKNYLNGLGLTEAQVQELIDRFEDEKIGDISQLSTTKKGNLVDAINELFQNVDSGKKIIADAIDDESISKDSTFAAMGEAIKDKLNFIDADINQLVSYKKNFYPFEVNRAYNTITNMDYTVKDNMVYYFVEGAPGTSTSSREAYIYKYNMDTKTLITSVKVDKLATQASVSCFLEEGILIFSNTSATLYNYDNLSQIKTVTIGGTVSAGSRILKHENYIYGSVLNGFVFKFDINMFTTVKSAKMTSSYTMNDPRVFIIDNGYIYAGTAYAGTGNGTMFKFDMDLTTVATSAATSIPGGISYVLDGWVYTVSGFFNGGTTPALQKYKFNMNSNGNQLELLGNMTNLDSIFAPTTLNGMSWRYFVINDDVFIAYNNVIAKFKKSDILNFTTNTPKYFCISSSGENIYNITQRNGVYEITTIGLKGASVFGLFDYTK